MFINICIINYTDYRNILLSQFRIAFQNWKLCQRAIYRLGYKFTSREILFKHQDPDWGFLITWFFLFAIYDL